MRPDHVSICRSDGRGGGTGVINIQRSPYGVRDRHRHPVMAVRGNDSLCQGLRAQGLC